MTRDDVRDLAPGDSIIGLLGRWHDEFPVVKVGPLQRTCRPHRSVTVADGDSYRTGTVWAGDQTIRGAML